LVCHWNAYRFIDQAHRVCDVSVARLSATMVSTVMSSEAATTKDDTNFDVILPSTGGDPCHVLIQIDPHNASQLDLEGSAGAIGRFEASADGLILDCRGFQYKGKIHPGPTVMVLSHLGDDKLKVEAVTNEFVTLAKVSNVMAKLNAVMVQGEMDDGYKIIDDNVNVNATIAKKSNDEKQETVVSTTKDEPPKKKRKSSVAPKKGRAKKD
jgi:hypothetical protein